MVVKHNFTQRVKEGVKGTELKPSRCQFRSNRRGRHEAATDQAPPKNESARTSAFLQSLDFMRRCLRQYSRGVGEEMSSLTDFPPCCLRNLLASAAYGVFTRGYHVSRVHIRIECGSESSAVASSFYTFLLYKCTGMRSVLTRCASRHMNEAIRRLAARQLEPSFRLSQLFKKRSFKVRCQRTSFQFANCGAV